MATATATDFNEKLSDITECSICAEIFTNPKILPCVHTFCLHCLEKYGKDQNPGDNMACPLCRNEFVIPQGGLSKLPNNFFISKIVEIGKLAAVPAKEVACDLCEEETAVAKMFCIDCEQLLCDRCSKSHTKIKHIQNHHVIDLGSQFNLKELNFCSSYCEHHPKELIKMYCHDDNAAICLICCVESHQSHKCSNVDKAALQFAEQLREDLIKVVIRRPGCDEAFQKLEKIKTEFTEDVLKTEKNIRKAGLERKKLIDLHTQMLIQNLRVVRDRNLKCLETIQQDVDKFRVMIDSYQRYCDELMASGSPVDICRAANQMHTRATELEKQPENLSSDDFICDGIAFRCADPETLMKKTGMSNIVGGLSITKSTDRAFKFQKRISENDVPVNWVTMPYDEELKIIQLSANDQEYQNVAKAVLSSEAQMTVYGIVKIVRIQNKLLYKQYLARKTAMDAANPGVQNEMTLWHGTTEDTLQSISRTGFSESNCGAKGFDGTGICFAKNFNYAVQQMDFWPTPSDLKYVYQCKVLTGKYVLHNTRASVFHPVSQPRNPKSTHDSIVDNIANPNSFVINCEYQAYPEYLIYFK